MFLKFYTVMIIYRLKFLSVLVSYQVSLIAQDKFSNPESERSEEKFEILLFHIQTVTRNKLLFGIRVLVTIEH